MEEQAETLSLEDVFGASSFQPPSEPPCPVHVASAFHSTYTAQVHPRREMKCLGFRQRSALEGGRPTVGSETLDADSGCDQLRDEEAPPCLADSPVTECGPWVWGAMTSYAVVKPGCRHWTRVPSPRPSPEEVRSNSETGPKAPYSKPHVRSLNGHVCSVFYETMSAFPCHFCLPFWAPPPKRGQQTLRSKERLFLRLRAHLLHK